MRLNIMLKIQNQNFPTPSERAIAILLTGIGAAMSLNMRIVPNPGDGIVQAVADTINKPVCFTKKLLGCAYGHNINCAYPFVLSENRRHKIALSRIPRVHLNMKCLIMIIVLMAFLIFIFQKGLKKKERS